ncbi:DUF2130 domain-containing protein [Candidatus Pacearchaeota archaeon]|nr:DUF2130 domain-containing protein [Candidatus Pacearchaeota archaeon]
MKSKVYQCPFCASYISKEKYEQVIRENEILKKKIESLEKEREQFKEKERKFEEEKKNLKKQMQESLKSQITKERQKLNIELLKYQEQIKKFKEKEIQHKEEIKKVRINEMKKAGSQLSKYESTIKKQAIEIENLKKGKTAQELGFDFENEMYEILKKEFQNDDVQHTGKKGDAIIYIKARNNEIIGTILVECKRTEKHASAHVEEVKRHKIDAKADVGILVTNGDFGKTKMDGFKNVDDILIIRPFSAVDFIKHIRKGLIDIDSLKLTKDEKNKEMTKLWNFIHSPEFESQMNSIFRLINLLMELDSKEIDLIDRRKIIENNLLKAHKLISEGIQNSKKLS